ncbi:MAG: DUF305 domain-containing protein [Mycobacterium sp.]
MKPTTRRPVTALMALAAVLLVSSCASAGSGGHADPAHSDQPVITGQPAAHNADDVAFVTNMIPHHQQAVDLSAMAPDRSTNPQLVALAKQISAAQQPEINVMKVFMVQWTDGAEDPMSPDPGHAGHAGAVPGMVDDATMTKLKSSSGADFDKLWLESMVNQHEGAVEIAKAEIANGDNVDAKAMAKNIVATQEAEIGQMKQLLGG